MNTATPILYTFRRCPYAIRARLALAISGVGVEMREVELRNKPQAMLDCSPKGTVPVLQLSDGRVIDESLAIMRWALAINDPDGWIEHDLAWADTVEALIRRNDGPFKLSLDRYKYPGRERSPEQTTLSTATLTSAEHHRADAEMFLRELTLRLNSHKFLMGDRATLPDFAIVPFVRQFAHVDKDWFYAAHAGPLAEWLDSLLQSPLFAKVMQK
ncbi:MAG: glutathione S-transferase [Usitatibacteraceae bacterium]